MNKVQLFGTLEEGSERVGILGYVVFWNIRNVDCTQDQFAEMLRNNGINEKYAREHNYRSAFIRALREMEEQRIIRKVDESPNYLLYQFTAEEKSGEGRNASLEYNEETIVVLDKKKYYKDRNFLAALVKGDTEIKNKVAEHFEQHKVRYSSSDVTRYVQKIFKDQADLLPLRQQGCLYFVPAGYQQIVENVQGLVRALGGGSSFDALPIPNVEASRSLVRSNLTEQVQTLYTQLAAEIAVMLEEDASEKMREGRWSSISNLVDRIKMYQPILPTQDTEQLLNDLSELGQSLFPDRVLDLGDEEAEENAA